MILALYIKLIDIMDRTAIELKWMKTYNPSTHQPRQMMNGLMELEEMETEVEEKRNELNDKHPDISSINEAKKNLKGCRNKRAIK